MRKFVFAALALPLVLAACELTPRQQCEAPYRAELRNVTAEAKDTREALARGYRFVPARNDFGLHWCFEHLNYATMCRAEDGLPMFDKRAISRAAEQAKLNVLVAQQRQLEVSIAACQAQYPE